MLRPPPFLHSGDSEAMENAAVRPPGFALSRDRHGLPEEQGDVEW